MQSPAFHRFAVVAAAFLAVLWGTAPAPAEGGEPVDWASLDLVSIEGEPMPAERFEGKAVLVVNTASFCGHTPQYSDLQAVWERYREREFVLLGVPSNDFGGQEPGTEAEIKEFCETNFDVDFPMTRKMRVRGENAHPLYRWAARATGPAGEPRWNFHKLLLGPEGNLRAWFPTRTSPVAPEVARAIEDALADASGS